MKSQLIKLCLVLTIIAGATASTIAGTTQCANGSTQPNVRSAGFRPTSITGKENAKDRVKKKCYFVECDGNTHICFMFGDSNVGTEGRMSRTEINCPTKGTSSGGGTLFGRIFTFDPSDPTNSTGYGCTNCDAEVANSSTGASAVISVYDDSHEFTTSSAYQAAP